MIKRYLLAFLQEVSVSIYYFIHNFICEVSFAIMTPLMVKLFNLVIENSHQYFEEEEEKNHHVKLCLNSSCKRCDVM